MSLHNFFVNLPLRYIYDGKEYLDYFLKHRIQPELGLDWLSVEEFPKSWHLEVADIFAKQGLKVSIHLPFLELRPGALDPFILEATRKRLLEAVDIAAVYSPVHSIAHIGYFPQEYDDFFSDWLVNSLTTWEMVLDRINERFPLFWENVYELEPEPIKDLLSHLGSIRYLGFCLDIGHWFCFGKGSELGNLAQWLQLLGPFLKHLHLHDNDGFDDKHLGLGAGNIPFVELFAGLEFLEISPTYTLEPHTKEDFDISVDFINSHKYWFSLLSKK